MEENKKVNLGWVKYVAVAAGGYLAWSNRTKIMRFLKDQGLSVPEMKKGLSDAVHTGVEKITGFLDDDKKTTRGGGDFKSGTSKDISKDASKTFHS